ncbi:MAG: M23 family metallopeptidase [Campylobacteraceae bacterium]|nr:M23 family metallopeptidase [Campylobacteraceae bacterium]
MKKLIIFLLFLTNLVANTIINGDIQVLRVDVDSSGKLTINDKEGFWFINPANENEKIAIVSSNYRAENDIIVKHFVDGDEQIIKFKLIKGEYKKEQITVSSSKVNLSKENQDRVKKESSEAYKIYAKTTPKFLFGSKFELPINSHITSSFGNARMFNETLRSYHSGTDFRAAIGTPIRAINDGIVVISQDRFYAGGSIVIDHGAGIYSQYYHLSKMNFDVGDAVKKGDIIGLSGDTGRVSGPHLHFGIMVNQNQVNPLNFIEAINYALFGE